MSVVVRGAVEVTVQGAAPRLYHPGEGFQIPRDTPHLAVNAGPEEVGLVVTYLMDKGAPVKIPVLAPDAPAPK